MFQCGQCPYCADKPKFGGPGRKKQRCAKRKCESTITHALRSSCSHSHHSCVGSLLSTTKSGVTEYHKISPHNFAQVCY